MMRFIAVSLVLLAGAKIWTQEQLYRSATEEALVHAYRSQAIAFCRAAPLPATSPGDASRTSRQRLASAFAAPTIARLEIGNRDMSVPIWELDHAAWAMRYTYPYIVLETSSPAARCSYDVKLGKAQISLL